MLKKTQSDIFHQDFAKPLRFSLKCALFFPKTGPIFHLPFAPRYKCGHASTPAHGFGLEVQCSITTGDMIPVP
jgi:hypothetical protein